MKDGDINIVQWTFDTARSPPIAYYNKLLEVLLKHDPNSTITAEYNEPWMEFFWSRYNGDETEYDYTNIHRCESLEEHVVTAKWAELEARNDIYGDWRYHPKDALDLLNSEAYNEDEPKTIQKDIAMLTKLLAK